MPCVSLSLFLSLTLSMSFCVSICLHCLCRWLKPSVSLPFPIASLSSSPSFSLTLSVSVYLSLCVSCTSALVCRTLAHTARAIKYAITFYCNNSLNVTKKPSNENENKRQTAAEHARSQASIHSYPYLFPHSPLYPSFLFSIKFTAPRTFDVHVAVCP